MRHGMCVPCFDSRSSADAYHDLDKQANDLDVSIPAGCTHTFSQYLHEKEGYCCDEREEWSEERLGYHQMLKRQRLRSVTKLAGKQGQKLDILESSTCVSAFFF
jgi:hypothetical protein